jgi:hypothetical protein
MYTASISSFKHVLSSLSAVLRKGEAYAVEKKIDESVLLNARLALDMFPLVRQVQLACDFTVRPAARLAGIAIPSFEDKETTFEGLYQRIDATKAFLDQFNAEQFEGSEGRQIQFTVAGNTLDFTGESYLLNFALPNLYFHVTAAYAILRHNGVTIGKRDYLGAGAA